MKRDTAATGRLAAKIGCRIRRKRDGQFDLVTRNSSGFTGPLGMAVLQVLAAVALAVAWHSTTPALADQPEQKKDLWEFISPFSVCTGDCNVALLAGKSVSRTPMTSIFIHFQGPETWQWDDAYIVTLSASRSLVRYGKYFSIDPEIGVGRYLGNAYGFETWLSLYLRWRYFPWSDYVRTSIGVGFGPSVASNVFIGQTGLTTTSGVGVANYFSPELELGLASQPSWGLVLRFHHRSNIWGVIPSNTDDAQFWTVGMRIHF